MTLGSGSAIPTRPQALCALDPSSWYPTRMVAPLFGVSEVTIVRYCRAGLFGEIRRGPWRRRDIRGAEILRRLAEQEAGIPWARGVSAMVGR